MWVRAHALAEIGLGIYPSEFDVLVFLNELATKQILSDAERCDWKDLLLIARSRQGLSADVIAAAQPVADHDPDLRQHMATLCDTRVPEWQLAQEVKRIQREVAQAQRWSAQRETFRSRLSEIMQGNFEVLSGIAKAYLGRYSDLDRHATPHQRLVEWLGADLAAAALKGFVTAIGNPEQPTPEEVSRSHSEGKYYHAELVVICGLAELVRQDLDLASVSSTVLLVGWLAWEHSYGNETGVVGLNLGEAIEAVLFRSSKSLTNALRLQITPQIERGLEVITGLYRATHDKAFAEAFWPLAKSWLAELPSLPFAVEIELLDIVLRQAPLRESFELVRTKLKTNPSGERRNLWLAGSFLVDFAARENELISAAEADGEFLWTVRNRTSQDRWSVGDLSARQIGFIIQYFGAAWPPAESPGSGIGDQNPWDASRFIQNAIIKLSSDASQEAMEEFLRLTEYGPAAYAEAIRHGAAQQQKLQRDALYVPPKLDEIIAVVNTGAPTSHEDMKAYILDHLDELQKYLRGSEIGSLDIFYQDQTPLIENDCRNRIIELLRPRMGDAVLLMAETQMPDTKRVDINAIRLNKGIPIEIKGQWHKELWEAPNAQLDALYTRDWRADGYGIFLALWFGHTPGKQLKPPPDGLDRPTSPQALASMLLERVPAVRRSKISIFVLDLSRARS